MRDTTRARQQRQETAAVRRELIVTLASQDTGPVWGRANRIRKRLRAEIRPGLRTVQSVLRDFFSVPDSLAR